MNEIIKTLFIQAGGVIRIGSVVIDTSDENIEEEEEEY